MFRARCELVGARRRHDMVIASIEERRSGATILPERPPPGFPSCPGVRHPSRGSGPSLKPAARFPLNGTSRSYTVKLYGSFAVRPYFCISI